MRAVLLLGGWLSATTAWAAPGGGQPGFNGAFSVNWVDDSIWSHCEMDVSVTPEAAGKVASECSWEDGPRYKKERDLTPPEVGSLRTLLRNADLYNGQGWGRDLRGLDLNLLTLRVDDGDRVVIVVVSLNDSFDRGPRRALVEALRAILDSTDARPRAASPKPVPRRS